MPVSRRKDPEFDRCRFCGGLLPEVRRSDMRFCPKGYTPPDMDISRPYPGPNQTCKDAFHNAEKGRMNARLVISTEPVNGPGGEDAGDRTVIVKGELPREATIADVFGRSMSEHGGFDPIATVANEDEDASRRDADEVTYGGESSSIASIEAGTTFGGRVNAESIVFADGGRADPTGSYETHDPTRKGPPRFFRPGRQGRQYSVAALKRNLTPDEFFEVWDALSLEEQLELVAESADIRRIVNLEVAAIARRTA